MRSEIAEKRGNPLQVMLAHDWLVGYRGGEAVLEHLALGLRARGHEVVGVATLFDDGRGLCDAVDGLPKTVSWLNGVPGGSGRLRRWLLPVYRWGVADLSAKMAALHRDEPFDVLVSTSSAVVKNVVPPPGVRHVCYCHSPARYVWSQSSAYGGGLRGLGLRLVRERFQKWDRETSNVDVFAANSSHTAREIERCYGRDSEVVFPPVRTEVFTPGADERGDYWLAVGALESYKRFDLAIEAANASGEPLVIAGKGSDEARLRSMAGDTVRFAGRVDDVTLIDLMRKARLLVFPQVEDFGIVAAEALSCGTPVVARRAGGALDMVRDGVEGALFDEPTAAALVEAIGRCPSGGAACRARAEGFGVERFESAMVSLVERAASEPTPTGGEPTVREPAG